MGDNNESTQIIQIQETYHHTSSLRCADLLGVESGAPSVRILLVLRHCSSVNRESHCRSLASTFGEM
jgi:hypothetical protein